MDERAKRIIGFGLIAIFLSSPAAAQQSNCGPMPMLRQMLTEKYGETEIRQGISDRGWLIHLFMTPDGATWTVAIEKPGQGVGCIVDSGKDFGEPPLPEPDSGEPS